MENINIPDGYQRVMPYLILPRADQFLSFMQTVFGATEKYKMLRDDNTIMHGEVQVGDSTIMFSQSTEEFATQPAGCLSMSKIAMRRTKKPLPQEPLP